MKLSLTSFALLATLLYTCHLYSQDTTVIASLSNPDIALIQYYDAVKSNDVCLWKITGGTKTKFIPAYLLDGIEQPQTATLEARQLNRKGLPEIIVSWTFSYTHSYGGGGSPGTMGGGWEEDLAVTDIWDIDLDTIIFSATTHSYHGNMENEVVLKDSLKTEAGEDSLDYVERSEECNWDYTLAINDDNSISITKLSSRSLRTVKVNDIETEHNSNDCPPDHAEGNFVLIKGAYVFRKQAK